MKIVNEKSLHTAQWSGGTTTQFLIYPESSVYSERNFLFRISSAVIQDEHSVFTSLEDYERILMVLEGAVELKHVIGNSEKNLSLGKYDQTNFSGKWKTESRGKITDFNVIFHPELKASLKIASSEKITALKDEFIFVWCLEGKVTFGEDLISERSFIYGVPDSNKEIEITGKACFVRISGQLLQTF